MSAESGGVREGCQRLTPVEPLVGAVPVLDPCLAEAPAQPDLATGHERRKVQEAGGDVAQHDVALVHPGDVGRHLVHDPTHPKTQATQLGVVAVGQGSVGDQVAHQLALPRAEGITQADELQALLPQARDNRDELGDQGTGVGGAVEAGHASIVAKSPGTPPAGFRAVARHDSGRVAGGRPVPTRQGPEWPLDSPGLCVTATIGRHRNGPTWPLQPRRPWWRLGPSPLEVPLIFAIPRTVDASDRPARSGRLLAFAAAGLALLMVLTAAVAIAPTPALGATALAARCDGVKLRTRPTTTARTLRSLSAGAKVTAVAKVSGSRWSIRCAGASSSGSSWWRITSINGRSVKSLYGVSYVYGATGLFKSAITPATLEAACGGVSLRTGPKTSATLKRTLAAGTDVRVYGTVTGGSWKATCNGSASSGTSWYRITHIAGVSVKTRYGVTYLYGAKGLFRAPTAVTGGTAATPKPAPTPTPTPTPTPAPTPTPTPAPTATPAPTPTPTPSAWANYTQGIDISHWQGTIDWAKVAASGKRFAFMKASQDTGFVDDRYQTNRAQAKANGLKVGAYHFAQPELTLTDTAGTPDPVPDAVAEADHFIDTATPQSGELIPVLDLEDYGKTATDPGLSPTDLRTWVRAFLERVYERTGVRAVIYTSPSFWSTRTANDPWPAANGYQTLWIAHWKVAAPTLPASNWGGLGWTFWQYTNEGTVPGISGRVDLDFYRSADFTPVLIP